MRPIPTRSPNASRESKQKPSMPVENPPPETKQNPRTHVRTPTRGNSAALLYWWGKGGLFAARVPKKQQLPSIFSRVCASRVGLACAP